MVGVFQLILLLITLNFAYGEEQAAAAQTCTPSLLNFEEGGMSREIVAELATAVGGSFYEPLRWLSNAQFFKFHGFGNLTLQAYGISGHPEKQELPVLVYCAGWTETTIKYAPFLYDLAHVNGYTVYSFDFRGQGFSETTMTDGGRVTHISTFQEYIHDLKVFADLVQQQHSGRRLVYVGNSLSGLVGLSVQAQHPGTFSRLALAAPVIKPLATLNSLVRSGIYWVHRLGFGKMLPVRLGGDITGLKLTHHDEHFLGWQKLRALAPSQLIVQGPSVSWLSALTEQGHDLLAAAARRPSNLTSPLLVLVADDDLFVDNESIFDLAHAYEGTIKVVKVAGSWHELWSEREDLYTTHVLKELLDFISVKTSAV